MTQYKSIAGPIGLTVGDGLTALERRLVERSAARSGLSAAVSGQGMISGQEQDYEIAVRKYAAIIDENAVGGWELLWIQQIPVTKLKVNIGGLIGVAAIGSAICAVIFGPMIGWGGGIITGVLVGGSVGAIIGHKLCKDKVTEFFNMLIFAKKN